MRHTRVPLSSVSVILLAYAYMTGRLGNLHDLQGRHPGLAQHAREEAAIVAKRVRAVVGDERARDASVGGEEQWGDARIGGCCLKEGCSEVRVIRSA